MLFLIHKRGNISDSRNRYQAELENNCPVFPVTFDPKDDFLQNLTAMHTYIRGKLGEHPEDKITIYTEKEYYDYADRLGQYFNVEIIKL